MRRGTVRAIVGWMIIVSHISILLYIFTLKGRTWDLGRQTTAALTIAPVFSAYFSSVVRNFVVMGTEFDPGPRVNGSFVAVCILIPLLLVSGVAYSVFVFPTEGFAEPDKLQKVLAGLETCLGGTVGVVVGNLFPTSPHPGR